MSTEYMRSDAFVRSELDYRFARVKDGVRANQRVRRVRRPRNPAERVA